MSIKELKDMAGKKQSDFLKSEEIIRLVSLYTEVDPTTVRKIIRATAVVYREALLKGYRISIQGVGNLKHTVVQPKEEREWFNPLVQRTELIPAHQAYNRPSFAPALSLKEDMRKLTEGHLFND